jgi:hypothetical protein
MVEVVMRVKLIILALLLVCSLAWAQDMNDPENTGEMRDTSCKRVMLFDDFAFCLASKFDHDSDHLTIVNISNPEAPEFVSVYNPEYCRAINDAFLRNDRLYLVIYSQYAGEDRIETLDFTNLNELEPIHIWRYHGAGDFTYIDATCAVGDTLFMVMNLEEWEEDEFGQMWNWYWSSFSAFSIPTDGNFGDPLFFTDVGDAFFGWDDQIKFIENKLVLRNQIDFCIIHIQEAISIVGFSIPFTGYYCDFNMQGNNLFVSGTDGFLAYDISLPDSIVLKGSYRLNVTPEEYAEAYEFVLNGNLAYIAYGEMGLRIIDISDPSAMYEVGCLEGLGDVEGICLRDNMAYLSSEDGLHIIDVSDPSNCNEVSCFDWNEVSRTDHVAPAPGISISSFPNPFNPNTTIAYSLPTAGDTTLRVYNTRGQIVKTLVCEPMETGNHSVTWDGTDDNGQPVGSGVYLYRLQRGTLSSTNKCLLLK